MVVKGRKERGRQYTMMLFPLFNLLILTEKGEGKESRPTLFIAFRGQHSAGKKTALSRSLACPGG